MPAKEFLTIREQDKTGKEDFFSETSVLRNDTNCLDAGTAIPLSKKWTDLYHFEDMRFDMSLLHPFTISFDVKYPAFADLDDDLNIARVFVGIKDPQKEYKESIEMGVYLGRIYMKHLFDVVNIPKNKLVEGVQLVLDVLPNLPDGRCTTTFKVIDQSGLEITAIKSRRFLTSDWKGGISTGAHFKSVYINGIQP